MNHACFVFSLMDTERSADPDRAFLESYNTYSEVSYRDHCLVVPAVSAKDTLIELFFFHSLLTTCATLSLHPKSQKFSCQYFVLTSYNFFYIYIL